MQRRIILRYHHIIQSRDLTYLNANNLYGHAMSQYLPTGGFRVSSDTEVETLDLDILGDESDDGYIY